jgi:hypothetical protein
MVLSQTVDVEEMGDLFICKDASNAAGQIFWKGGPPSL